MASNRRRKRMRVLAQASGEPCSYCEQTCDSQLRTWSVPTIDHATPRARGGARRGPNEVLSCMGCNQSKGDMTAMEYRYFLRTGELHGDYLAWLTDRITRHARARGITVGPIDVAPSAGVMVPINAMAEAG